MKVIDYFDRGALLNRNSLALESAEGRYTFDELQLASQKVAAGLAARGECDLARVAVYSHNTIDAFPCILGAFRAGCIMVPSNARDELAATVHFLNLTKTSWLFYHSSLAEKVDQLREQVPSLVNLVCIDQDCGDDKSLQRFMDEEGDGQLPEVPFDPHRLFYYAATGGTTGLSKAVVWDNLVWDTCVLLFNWMTPTDIDPVHLCVAPISHTAGPLAIMLMANGVKNVVLPGFDPTLVLETIEQQRVTHLFLPPTALYALLSHPDVSKYDYSSLRYFLIGAAPVSPDKLKEAVEVFGPCICQAFGQSESPAFLTWMPPKLLAEAATNPTKAHRLLSCGQPSLGMRVEMMDDDGKLLPRGERGEIVTQGNLLSREYLDNPEATAEMRQFGWHHTGDIGYMDDDGFVYIVDRKKDMVITGGFNVYPAEVEAGLLKHPVIQDAAVVGVPDEKWGELVKAVVTLKAGKKISEDELMAFCKHELGSVKAPKSIEFWEALPRTAAGKISRKDVRKTFWEGHERSV